jgi:hypothetical protein
MMKPDGPLVVGVGITDGAEVGVAVEETWQAVRRIRIRLTCTNIFFIEEIKFG